MTRFALAALLATGLAGSAFAMISKDEITSLEAPKNETIISKTQTWDPVNSLTVEECATETCEEASS